MKVFLIIMIVVSGLGFIPLMNVMAKPAATINVSEIKSFGHVSINRMPQDNAFADHADLSSGKDTKKSTVRRGSVKKLKKFRKYQIDKKKLLLVLSIFRKH